MSEEQRNLISTAQAVLKLSDDCMAKDAIIRGKDEIISDLSVKLSTLQLEYNKVVEDLNNCADELTALHLERLFPGRVARMALLRDKLLSKEDL